MSGKCNLCKHLGPGSDCSYEIWVNIDGSTTIRQFASKTSFNDELYSRRHIGRYVRKMQLMLTSMANFSVLTNIVDLDQTALNRAV